MSVFRLVEELPFGLLSHLLSLCFSFISFNSSCGSQNHFKAKVNSLVFLSFKLPLTVFICKHNHLSHRLYTEYRCCHIALAMSSGTGVCSNLIREWSHGFKVSPNSISSNLLQNNSKQTAMGVEIVTTFSTCLHATHK